MYRFGIGGTSRNQVTKYGLRVHVIMVHIYIYIYIFKLKLQTCCGSCGEVLSYKYDIGASALMCE